MGKIGIAVVLLLVAGAPLACSRSKDPTNGGASCGELGGACSPEGASCAPAPIGTGWSHMMTCQGGTWQTMEIAPLGTTPPPTPSAPGACSSDQDCVLVFNSASDCCVRCEARAVTVADRDALTRACAGKGGSPSCPNVDCPKLVDHAACDHGACIIVPGRVPATPSASK